MGGSAKTANTGVPKAGGGFFSSLPSTKPGGEEMAHTMSMPPVSTQDAGGAPSQKGGMGSVPQSQTGIAPSPQGAMLPPQGAASRIRSGIRGLGINPFQGAGPGRFAPLGNPGAQGGYQYQSSTPPGMSNDQQLQQADKFNQVNKQITDQQAAIKKMQQQQEDAKAAAMPKQNTSGWPNMPGTWGYDPGPGGA